MGQVMQGKNQVENMFDYYPQTASLQFHITTILMYRYTEGYYIKPIRYPVFSQNALIPRTAKCFCGIYSATSFHFSGNVAYDILASRGDYMLQGM